MTMILYLFFFLVLLLPVFTLAADPLAYVCNGDNYPTNSTFQSNLNLLLTSLSSSNANFTTDTKGSIPDRAYGLILCRGDSNPSDCLTCIENAAQNILSLCPLSKQATIWNDNCELRYSNLQFFSVLEESNPKIFYNLNNATDQQVFAKLEMELLEKVMNHTAYNSSLNFATGIASSNGSTATSSNGSTAITIYALAQCTRDLSMDNCKQCLQSILGSYGDLKIKQGGRVLGQSCNFIYESYPFFKGEPTISLNLSTSSASEEQGSKNNTSKVLLIVIPIAVSLALILIVGICYLRRSAKNICSIDTDILEEISSAESLLFDLSILKVATDNFNDLNKLGQGGFGIVYKGTLSNGEEIAVKRLSASSRQGIQELKNELVLVAKLQHKNLVRLRGVCLEEDETLLIYEYVSNGSLDNFLFDPVKCKQLNWETRFKIIWGIARGLLYLHEESHLKVIHRDLKASNILLDANMDPKISDFGLARLFGEDETQCVTNRVVGTFGYMAPEYARRGHVSIKVDIYSFGILVLEIVTGKRSNSFQYDSEISRDILSYTWEHWRTGRTLEIIDPSMGEISLSDEVLKCIQIGLLCTQEVPVNRPSMRSVFFMLHGSSMSLQEPLQSELTAEISMVDSTVSLKQSDFSDPVKNFQESPLLEGSTREWLWNNTQPVQKKLSSNLSSTLNMS